MPKPNPVFRLIRADEVAECWDGVGHELYCTLWNDIVPLQKPIPNLEDTGPGDHVGHAALAKFWKHLTEADQVRLNELAARKDEEDAEFFRN